MRLFTDVATLIDDPMLRRAYQLAERGRVLTSPNPMVGCVIAQDDEIVGEGFHPHVGGPHAEIVALAQAGPRAAGATAYVTLEPCNHVGRTGPCTEALIGSGIAGVVVGMLDPNPLATGGAARLREAGVEVELAVDSKPFEILNEAWLVWLRDKRPFVQVKVAVTLDGHASLSLGSRSGITGAGGRDVTMRLRAAADAVLVGASTARVDRPQLTVRDTDDKLVECQPVRVVWSRSAVPDVPLFHDGLGPSAALVPDSLASSVYSMPDRPDVISYLTRDGIVGALRALGDRGVTRVLVEAGPGMFSALMDADAIDELVLVHAGGLAGPGAPALYTGSKSSAGESITTVLRAFEAGVVGEDAVTVWRRRIT